MPAEEKTKRMAESYQRKHCCGDEGKDSWCHFSTSVLVAFRAARFSQHVSESLPKVFYDALKTFSQREFRSFKTRGKQWAG
jgi:hypothetical protein